MVPPHDEEGLVNSGQRHVNGVHGARQRFEDGGIGVGQ
jgi:hypothetical protein